MENYSKEWKDLQNYNEATFSDLPPGTLYFEKLNIKVMFLLQKINVMSFQ